MTKSVKIRLMIFLTLAVVGVTYVSAAYLGMVDKVLGRDVNVALDLPASGGLYEGSSVNYRGIQVGTVSDMNVTDSGVRVALELDHTAQVPKDAAISVHNLSAVGEQYVNFEPTSSAGPYLGDGDTIAAGADALPQTTDELLTSLSEFTESVEGRDLRVVVKELGTMFRGNAANLREILDSGSTLVDEAVEHEDATVDLLNSGERVLDTQLEHRDDILTFSRGLAKVTKTLEKSDPTLEQILQGGPDTMKQVDSLVQGLQPLLPVFLTNLTTVNRVFTARLPALEQVLVTFPQVVATGFTGTPGDGYGHLNMQLTYTTPACSEGYKPSSQWLPGTQMSAPPAYPAKCTDPRAQPEYTGDDAINQRGVNMVPPVDPPAYTIAPYDTKNGQARLDNGRTVTMAPDNGPGPLGVLGSDEGRAMAEGTADDD